MAKFDAYEHLHVILNSDGSLTRLLNIPTLPATSDEQAPGQAVVSKDIVLDANKKTWLRIFRPNKLPSNDKSVVRLPVVIYFHGGGWIDIKTDAVMVHENCNLFSSEIPAIVISVSYRLAPESRLPAQYDDAVDAIQWLKKQAIDQKGEQWLRDYGDFSRCYLYGTSNGANIAFNAALRALDLKLQPLRFGGLIMNQPMFSGRNRTKSELQHATDDILPLPALDLMWELALPPGTDRDHRYSNPMLDKPCREKIKSLGRCLVIGYGDDIMIDRQQDFVQMLVLQGVSVEAQFDNIGFHGIDLVDSRRASALLSFVKEFI
ncbi:probable carboxylesterase 9 [Cornus florida]|uniref:probable carboxylesterase 9 n=1 Tax=Cornus florida TaxID=4283 RepID=UPI002899E6B4|nr:probable carboxylesterase 9 [Cornus florida]